MIRRPPRSTLFRTLFLYTTLFRPRAAPADRDRRGRRDRRAAPGAVAVEPRDRKSTRLELQSHGTISYAVFCLKKKKEKQKKKKKKKKKKNNQQKEKKKQK